MKEINNFFRKNNYCGVFLVFSLIMSFMMMNNTFAASTLTLTSSGSQDINVGASAGSAISADSINVATNCRYGYNLTLSTSVNDNNLYLNGDSSNNTTGTYFSPVDGTSALNATTNMWGYYYNASTAPTNTSVFSPVPTLANPATVKTPLTTPASSDINDSFNIYYGVSVLPTMAKGTYKMIPDTNNSNNDGTLVYTATVADECSRYTVHFNPTGTSMGTSITGTGTVADQIIYEGVATNLTNSYFTGPTVSGTQYYFLGWNTAQDGTGTSYIRGQSVTDLTAAGSTITLYAMWTDCPGGKICYSANVFNPNDVEGEMGNQTVSNRDTSATLYAPNFKRSNYGFAAWNTKADGTGTNYGPNQTIRFTAGQYRNGGLRLYAKWVVSAGNMQNWTGCSSMNQGDVTALKDTRDNDVYAVAKLADGKCWTIENLRLADKDSSNNDINLTSANTHNPSTPLNNSWYYNNQQGTLTTSNHLSATSDPTSTNPDTAWCRTNSSDCDDQSMLATNNTTLFTSNTSSGYSASSNVYSYGNYYNWYSATVGHGKYSSSNNISSYIALGDICSAGWHLPTSGNVAADFGVLDIALGGTGKYSDSSTTPTGDTMSQAYTSYPNNFVRSGIANGPWLDGRNSSGDYWSASEFTGDSAYFMSLYSTSVYPSAYSAHRKYTGFAVRCIADD